MMVTHAMAKTAAPAREGAGEVMLRDALAREARAPRGLLAVAARLSLLPPPGPPPHQRRVVRTLMEDCARRHDGQVLLLRSGDLVLLAPPAAAATPGSPQALPALLARLLQAQGLRGEAVAEAVPFAEAASLAEALLAAPAPPPPSPPITPRDPPRAGGLALPALSDKDLAGLLSRATAARIPPPRIGGGGAGGIRPAYRAVAVAPALLARLPGAAALSADPWLRLHLAAALDPALLRIVEAGWGQGGPLDPAPRPGVAPLLLPLGLTALLGAPFAAFARACRAAGAEVHIAVAAAEAVSDPAAFAAARARLDSAGLPLVLDRLDPHALVATRPEALGAALLRVAWSPALLRLPPPAHAALAGAVLRIGAGRVVLAGADDEAAIRWGRALGVAVFEGRHVESMLAATRLLACPHAAACGLGPCAGRAAAAQPAGRTGCANPTLLDQAVPPAIAAGRRAA